MAALTQGPGRAPVAGGTIAFLVQGDGLPLATTHPYTVPKAGFGAYEGIATITVYPRGFGDSVPVRTPLDFGFWQLADDLDAVRRHLGLDRWAYWGTSMGGFTGLIYALKYQPTLTALILDSTAASVRYRDDPDSIWPHIRQTPESAAYFRDKTQERLDAFFIEILRAQNVPEPEKAWQRSLEMSYWNPGALPEIIRRIGEFDTEPRLGEIRIPTLVLQGGKDAQCPPRQGQILARGIPGAQYEVFPETGPGVLMRGRPGQVTAEWERAVQVATAFLRRAARSAPTAA